MPRHVHVVGAGLAGLSAAVQLTRRGIGVTLWEAAVRAGGRCRSYLDPVLGIVLDNGAHIVLSGNRAALDYLRTIGAADRLRGPASAAFDFFDRATGERWQVRPNRSPIPWWIAAHGRRVPGTRMWDYAALIPLLLPRPGALGDRLRGAAGRRLADPLVRAALNIDPVEGSAALAAAVLRGSIARGGAAARPLLAERSLDDTFVAPALAWIARHGGTVRTHAPLRALHFVGDRVSALVTAGGDVRLGPHDDIVLCVPGWTAGRLVPGLVVPDDHRGILNVHFGIAPPADASAMTGVIGGTAEWIFTAPDRITAMVSAADRLFDADGQTLAGALWSDAAAVLGLPDPMPRWTIVKERRATFAATPAQQARRPGAATRWGNLFLAGDWTATGLPATIEGAIRSGDTAARLAARGRRD